MRDDLEKKTGREACPTSIAHYRITAKLGEGGMGAVYRATDTKLGREVALKVLPPAFAEDAARMARFEREAQVLASLNHPNIAAIYGIEQGAIVMELVEGDEVKGPLPVETARDYARQIALALEAAHEKGVIHRDLKPANIKVTGEGVVKILDFGLAKVAESSPPGASPTLSPTLSMAMTQAGMILGTAAYMPPEQAKGKPVDRRGDIWAFGVVLYEMLTGRQMYTGETVSETLASVIKDTPDLTALPEATPPEIRRLLRRCLEKEPRRRLQAIGEARFLLEEPAEEVGQSSWQAEAPAPPRRTVLPWIIAGALALTTLVAAAIAWRATRPEDRPMLRFSADLGPDAVAGVRTTAAISPDGTRIAYPVRTSGGTQLATRLMDQSKAIVLSGTEDARDAFFSPNGQWIGFFAGGKLKKISVQGGAPLTLCEDTAPNGDRGGSWGEDGAIVATLDTRRIFRIPEAGGKPQLLPLKADEKDATQYRWPQILPGGEAVLVTGGTVGNFDDANIAVVSLRTGDPKIVARGGYFGRYLPSGHLIYIHQGTLFAVPFDARRFETHGTPAPVLQDMAGSPATGSGQLDFSRSGTLVYLSGGGAGDARAIAWMDAAGKKTPLFTQAGVVFTPRLSRDGKNLALTVTGDVFIYDPQRGAMTRITLAGSGRYPVWTPDGKHIVYGNLAAGGIWWTRADGSRQPERLLETPSGAVPGAFSPDGRRLAFSQPGEGTNLDIWILPLDTADPDRPKPGKPELFLRTPAVDNEPAFSPDGRWLAYTSAELGGAQVYVRPYPAGAASGKWQISTAGGHFPIWSRTAKELFYEGYDGRIMVADYIAKGEIFSPGKPRRWSDTPILIAGSNPNLDLAPDGKRFVVFPTADTAGADKASLHVTFLVNFFGELKRRMP
ncbi:Serine/threonine protein kinase [Candidatus Sulfopaludibacter sp. SbA4]|nr:Serine/threonine protein kinase [Candidatus Sulfopaludibacter sp. SbA4]